MALEAVADISHRAIDVTRYIDRGGVFTPGQDDPAFFRQVRVELGTITIAAERDFHAALQAAVPAGYTLFAQVRLAGRIADKLGIAPPAPWPSAQPQKMAPLRASPERGQSVAAPAFTPAGPAPAPILPLSVSIPNLLANPPVQALSSYDGPVVAARYACGQCQAGIRPEAKFCSHCGATLTP